MDIEQFKSLTNHIENCNNVDELMTLSNYFEKLLNSCNHRIMRITVLVEIDEPVAGDYIDGYDYPQQ